MKKVILSMMTSLDAAIARPDGDLGWTLNDAEFERYLLDLLHSVDAMLLGRVTYQMFEQFWPFAGTPESRATGGEFTSKENEAAFAERMNNLPKVVYSRTLERADWGPARIVRDHLAEDLAEMKRQPGKDLVLFAGASIATAFMNLDLFDQYRLLVHPIALGKGIGLFDRLEHERPLKLVRTRAFPCGVTLLQYDRDRGASG